MARSPRLDPALGVAVRQLREEHGVTREALAFKADITISSLARVELVQTTPGWDTVRSIASALGVSLVDFAAAVEAAE
ncbi:MAG TPA: helix-turn-helix transcriptional regulator [Solirubrobacteraceae bacterium]|nr:helix-turn-helix transcriptional regulator [Solirubrobacteraceae bacterium]